MLETNTLMGAAGRVLAKSIASPGVSTSPHLMMELFNSETAKWAKVVKNAGIKVE